MAAARSAKAELEAGGLLRAGLRPPKADEFIVSDAPDKFKGLALKLLKIKTGKVKVMRF